MIERWSTEKFIQEASKIHQNYYNYDKVLYKNMHTEVIIIDPVYGEFSMKPYKHLKGNSLQSKHPKERNGKMNTEYFIRAVLKRYGEGIFDFTGIEVNSVKQKIVIRDIEYGSYSTKVEQLLYSNGLHPNRRQHKMTKEEFISRATKVHNGRFTYDHVRYEGAKKKVIVYDTIREKYYAQAAYHHLEGHIPQTVYQL